MDGWKTDAQKDEKRKRWIGPGKNEFISLVAKNSGRAPVGEWTSATWLLDDDCVDDNTDGDDGDDDDK